MESQRTAIEDQLRRRGYKLTKQREAIIKVLDSLEENLATAQHIFEKVTETNPGTNFSTVYRNLDLLVQEGILRKTSLGHEASYYELVTNDTHHHHMICKECGKIRCVTAPLRIYRFRKTDLYLLIIDLKYMVFVKSVWEMPIFWMMKGGETGSEYVVY